MVCVPPALEPGSRVAVCRPAAVPQDGNYPDHLIELGFERLREMFGLDPVALDSLTTTKQRLYDDPDGRARELEAAFRDPDIDGIIAAIGGDDQIRILKHLDPAIIRDNPTRFYGTSDNTSVAAFCRAQGLVTFYGGTLFTDICEPGTLNDYTREYLERAFFEDSLGELTESNRYSDEDLDWHNSANLDRDPEYEDSVGHRWHGSGTIEGRTWGGCLEVLATHLMANAYIPEDTAGTVLLLETSEELPEAATVRRVVRGLGERGALDVGAVLVGRAKARGFGHERSPAEREQYRERQRAVIIDTVREYSDAIVVTDVAFGHTRPSAPIPVGGLCRVDAEMETLRFG